MTSYLIVIRTIHGTEAVWTEDAETHLKRIERHLKPMGLLKEARIYRIEGRKKILEKVIK